LGDKVQGSTPCWVGAGAYAIIWASLGPTDRADRLTLYRRKGEMLPWSDLVGKGRRSALKTVTSILRKTAVTYWCPSGLVLWKKHRPLNLNKLDASNPIHPIHIKLGRCGCDITEKQF
jgi:hypothetical protein